MKPLLVISLALNLGLVAGIGVILNKRSAPAPVAVAAAPVVAKTANAVSKAAVAPSGGTNLVGQKFDWRSVESEDYKKYIANLRAIGCPEATIRDIILADVNKMFADRKQALKKPVEKFKFWETGVKSMAKMMGGALDEEAIKQRQALAAEKRAIIKELLGIEPDEKPDLMAGFNPFDTMLDFLPADKQTKLMELMQTMQAKQMKALGDGAPDADGMKNMQKAQKEMEDEIAKILTPSEFEDYQLRLSQTAMMLRMQLGGFSPTEQEFRDIFKYQKAFDDQYSMFDAGTDDKAEQDKRKAAQTELDTQIKATLGDQRYADYQREKDFEYQSIAKIAEKQGLPKEAGVKIYDMKAVAQEQAKAIRNDKTLTGEQRQTALAGIRAETEKAMQETLGEKGYNAYKKNAYWLNTIYVEPKAAPASDDAAQ
ncbi:MAG: hypothetical protein NTZ16_10045 [Verrucomicrobia bacterium]|nr:hypothetical protein [Verrucomicrobiota bacterium]